MVRASASLAVVVCTTMGDPGAPGTAGTYAAPAGTETAADDDMAAWEHRCGRAWAQVFVVRGCADASTRTLAAARDRTVVAIATMVAAHAGVAAAVGPPGADVSGAGCFCGRACS